MLNCRLMNKTQNIHFYFNATSIGLPNRNELKKFLSTIFSDEGRAFSNINFIFCTDQFLLSINNEFLDHDDYTDIITFSLGAPKEPIIGEIYISTERIRENAVKHGCTIKNEIHRVMFHGVLHLCGYKDKTVRDKLKMTAKENHYLDKRPF